MGKPTDALQTERAGLADRARADLDRLLAALPDAPTRDRAAALVRLEKLAEMTGRLVARVAGPSPAPAANGNGKPRKV